MGRDVSIAWAVTRWTLHYEVDLAKGNSVHYAWKMDMNMDRKSSFLDDTR
jgi:hypothetical protein